MPRRQGGAGLRLRMQAHTLVDSNRFTYWRLRLGGRTAPGHRQRRLTFVRSPFEGTAVRPWRHHSFLVHPVRFGGLRNGEFPSRGTARSLRPASSSARAPRKELVVVGAALLLPIPLLALSGLSVPLPHVIERGLASLIPDRDPSPGPALVLPDAPAASAVSSCIGCNCPVVRYGSGRTAEVACWSRAHNPRRQASQSR